jgi:alkaline phosphatase D
MPDADDLGGRDEPASGPADHAELLSTLDARDVATAIDPAETDVAPEFDTDAGPGEAFPQSVASGGPTPSGVILWTRIAPDRFDPEEPLAVQVATDETFDEVVFGGRCEDGTPIRAHDYTVKVDLDGELEPDSEYAYRFVYDGVESRTGWCQTLPAPEDSPDSLRLAVLTCQNLHNGYFPALARIAEADVDFVVHLGDYIYEAADGAFLGLGSRSYPGRRVSLPSGHDRVWTLADYRHLYRTYRADPFLQALHEAHTVLPSWDDHEMVDDLYWDPETNAPAGHHPRGDDPTFMTALVADAMHAWWEYMPARVAYDPAGEHLQDRVQLWRSIEYGDLVTLAMTDERLFRDPPREAIPTVDNVGPHREPPGRSMLGEEQRDWLLETITGAETTWTVWADEVLTVPFRIGSGPLSVYPVQGGWDGYTRERQGVTEAIGAADVENFVTITGDMHCTIAGYTQTAYPGRVTGGEGVSKGERIGVEFMTPAVTSLNVAEALHLHEGLRGRLTEPVVRHLVTAMNPHLEFFDSHHWGYSVVEFTREDCTFAAYSVDKTEHDPEAEQSLVVAYRVPEGESTLVEITDEYRAGPTR